MRQTITEGKRLMTRMSILISCIQSIISAESQCGNHRCRIRGAGRKYSAVTSCLVPITHASREAGAGSIELTAPPYSAWRHSPQASPIPAMFHNIATHSQRMCEQIILGYKSQFLACKHPSMGS